MAIVSIDLSSVPAGLSKREFLRAVGFDVKDRGQLSKDQRDALNVAERDGYAFPAPVTESDEKPEVLISQKELELEPLRQWLLDNGHKIAEKGRIAQKLLNEYITANPDAPRRSMLPDAPKSADGKVEIKPLPNFDGKAARKWAIAQGLEVPEHGRLPRWIAEKFIASHEDAGTEVPTSEPDHTNNFGPAAPRVNFANWFEGTDSAGAKVRKSWRDADAQTGYSIGYVPGDVYAWSPNDSDEMVLLSPVA